MKTQIAGRHSHKLGFSRSGEGLTMCTAKKSMTLVLLAWEAHLENTALE